MQPLAVVFRVDASAAIGLGHLKRCLSLAHALRDAGAQVRFVMRPLGLDVAGLVEAAGFALHLLPAPGPAPAAAHGDPPHAHWAEASWADDARQTVAATASERPGWLVVDHYAFDVRWHRHVAAAVGARVVVIDDLADRDLATEMVVDHNLAADHAAKYRGRIGPTTRLLGGPRFALLAPAFRDAPAWRCNDEVRSIGVFMGGGDAGALSAVAVRACRDHARFAGLIEVVVTAAGPHRAQLEALAGDDAKLQLSFDLLDLAAFFARHDLQIGAGGGAAWERCRVGAPGVTVVAADNQRAVVPTLVEHGVTLSLPPHDRITAEALAVPVRKLLADAGLRRALSEASRRLVDGLGARRVALAIAAARTTVRPATRDDALTLLGWRNHPSTRAVSRHTDPINEAGHRRWLDRTLADPQRLLLVGCVGSIDIGAVRFDLDGAGDAEVSIHLDPSLVGLGLGGPLLTAGEARLREHAAGARRFVATVLDGNTGSRRLFESAGYRPVGDHWEKPAHTALQESA